MLEVGSGDLGLTPYASGFELTGLDRSFEHDNPAMKQVAGSALKLPFADHRFDAVISVDSLEHIAPGERGEAVREIVRTALRMAVIAVLGGAGAQRQDRGLAELYLRVRGEEYPFFRDHLENGLPARDELETMVAGP